MKRFKHYSFDLWMTLIRSNPDFKKQRTKYFFNHFNYKGKTLDEVGIIFRQIDVMCNAINEKTGSNIDSEEMYLMVISAVNDYTFALHDIDIEDVYTKMEELLLEYLPVPFSNETLPSLWKLKDAGGATFSLLSNTGFIKGRTLRKVLKALGLEAYFDFQIYSDEEGMSKPNAALFELLIRKTKQTRAEELGNYKEIIHIGDNVMADIHSAEKAGISSLLINSNNQSILNLLD